MIAPFRAFLILVLTLVDAHLNFTSVVANWTEVADGPSGRECHAIAPLSDGRLLMYGGNTQRKDGLDKFFNDTYIYTPSSYTSSNGKGVTSGEGSWTKVADGPGARQAHAMAPLSNGRVLMYGGGKMVNETYQITEILNDAYIYTLSSLSLSNGQGVTPGGGTWTKVADGPSARYAHAMAPLSGERVLMYGGWLSTGDQNIIFNDAYIYTPSSSMSSDGKGVTAGGGTWTKVADGPSARQAHAMAPLPGGRVLMYGGGDYNIALNDTYIYTPSSSMSSDGKGVTAGGGTWTKVAAGPSCTRHYTDVPCGRSGQAMAPLSGGGKVLMYGGGGGYYGSFLNDTYIYTPSSSMSSNGKGVTAGEGSWTKVADGPNGRYNHAMAPLSNGRVLMYGGYDDVPGDGYNGYGYLNDTWIIESPEVPSICCQTKSSDHKDDKAKCATFLDSKSCDDYSKGFGDFCIWKC